jgi:hypothetical protein
LAYRSLGWTACKPQPPNVSFRVSVHDQLGVVYANWHRAGSSSALPTILPTRFIAKGIDNTRFVVLLALLLALLVGYAKDGDDHIQMGAEN